MSRKTKLIGLLLISLSFSCLAQENNLKRSFIEPEYMVGKILPNAQADNFPSLKPQQVIAVNIGAQKLDTNSWARYYNFPETGIMLLYSNLGDNQTFGHQWSVLPFITFNVLNKYSDAYKFRLSAGASYFSTFHDPIENPNNESVGSHLTWDVKAFLYREIIQSKNFKLKFGIGFSHESNGHTQLPNLGVNSFLASLSGQFYSKKNTATETPLKRKYNNLSTKKHFINFHQGYGFHEQDATEGPMINRVKPVYSSYLSYGIIFNNHIKLRAGFAYRFYEQFNTHLKENSSLDLNDQRIWSSSNIIFFVGNEFLMNHFGIDAQLGFNLHKPFYNEFNRLNDIGTTLRKVVSSRLGVNIYLKNTNKPSRHNAFIGAHINANMAKADFSEFSLGYLFLLHRD